MPLTDVPWAVGTEASTRVTSAYALEWTKATSVPPPAAKIRFGRQSANVEVAPLRGSTRVIRPAIPSVTYRAPSGPRVLPKEPCSPDTSCSAAPAWAGGEASATAGAASIRAAEHSKIHQR